MAKRGPNPKKSRKGRVGKPSKVYERKEEFRSAAELANPPASPDSRAALVDFTAALRDLYGSRLDSVVLYGSRARGEAELLSDVDTLVVLKEREDFWAEFDRICPIASRVCLDHGVVISARPSSVKELAESGSPLFLNIRREGKRVA